MIVLRTPKGWTGPREVDGVQVEGTWRAHQVPVVGAREDAGHRKMLEEWLRSYRPEELFDEDGRLRPELRALAPRGRAADEREPARQRRRAARRISRCPTSATTPSRSTKPGTTLDASRRASLGGFLRDVIVAQPADVPAFGPDETASNRLGDVFAVTGRAWDAETRADGRGPRRRTGA